MARATHEEIVEELRKHLNDLPSQVLSGYAFIARRGEPVSAKQTNGDARHAQAVSKVIESLRGRL